MGFQFWTQVGPVIILLILGFSVGGWVERAHLRRLDRREKALRHVFVTDLKTLPAGCAAQPCGLVTGEVVVASDYFKTFAAGLRKILGGELRTYDSLLTRARREALVRVMEAAHAMGANHVINVRLTTSNISGIQRRKAAAMVEVCAYGTAVYVP